MFAGGGPAGVAVPGGGEAAELGEGVETGAECESGLGGRLSSQIKARAKSL